MSDRSDQRPADVATGHGDGSSESDPQLVFLEELVQEHATIEGDLIEIDAHTWAIHGSIAVDGDVIMAEYESEEHARFVLGELSVDEHRADHR
jgi:hypothetical protein